MKKKLFTITILIILIIMLIPLNVLASTIYEVYGFDIDLSKVGYLKYNGYTDRGYSYTWVDNPNYEIQPYAPSSRYIINLVMIYASSDTDTLSMYEVYETLYNENTQETYRTLVGDGITTKQLSGDAATVFADNNVSTQVASINLDDSWWDSNRTTNIYNNIIYSTVPIINYGVFSRAPLNDLIHINTNERFQRIFNQEKNLTGFNPFYQLPKIAISPSGYFGNESRDIDITTIAAKHVEVYLINGYGEQYLLDSYDVFNLVGVNTVRIYKENINWALFTDLDIGLNKIKVVAYDMNYVANPMVNNVFVEKSVNIMWTIDILGGDGDEPLPNEVVIESPLNDYQFYSMSAYDGMSVQSNSILIKTIFKTKTSDNILFKSNIANSVVGQIYDYVESDNGEWCMGYVDITVPLKKGDNEIVLELRDNKLVGSVLRGTIRLSIYNSALLGGGAGASDSYDDYVGADGKIDVDATLSGAWATFLDFFKNIKPFINTITSVFSWLPTQIYALLILAISLGIVYRIVGR